MLVRVRDGVRSPLFVGIDLKREPEDRWLCKSYYLGKYSSVGKKMGGVLAKNGASNRGGDVVRRRVLLLGPDHECPGGFEQGPGLGFPSGLSVEIRNRLFSHLDLLHNFILGGFV